jgi:ABC-type proline/glycine betaine transport system ATPase subunit
MSSTVPKSSNIFWHDCLVGKTDRQKLLNQKGCVVWITGLSGSGKQTLFSLELVCCVLLALLNVDAIVKKI